MLGLGVKKNAYNGFNIVRLHYTADPNKATKEWFDKTRKGYSEAAWRKEYEIDFEVLSGTLVYPEYDPYLHLIPKSLINFDKLNSEGARFRILDHGQTNPTAMLWIWVDRDDNWIVYREYYVAGQTVPFHAQNIKVMSGRESYQENIADPSIFYKTQQDTEGSMFSIAKRYEEHGISFSAGNNDFKSGSDIIRERLKKDDNRINPFTGEKGAPGIYFVREECKWTDWEIKKWRYQEFTSLKVAIDKNPKETPVDKDNHIMDVLTYFANARKDNLEPDEEKMTMIQRDIHKIMHKKEKESNILEDLYNTQ